MAVVLETQVMAAASSIRFDITQLGGSNLISFHRRGTDDAADEEDSTMQSGDFATVHMKQLLHLFELTLTSTLLHQLLLITDQLACRPGRGARDGDDHFNAVDQSGASFSCKDDDECYSRRQCAKMTVSSSRMKKVQLPPIITRPDGGHRCPYIPCPICHRDRNSRAGMFEGHDSSSADSIFDTTNLIKCAVIIAPVACPDLHVCELEFPCEDDCEFHTKKAIAGSSRTKNNRLLPAITSYPDGGRCRCPYNPCPVCHPARNSSHVGNSFHEADSDSISADNILINATNIKCEVKAPVVCPNPHVCKEFPCEECHHMRSNPTVQLSSDLRVVMRKMSGLITSQVPTTLPDGGRHRCTYFPCPVCHPGR